jgi:hypothetical protein
MIRSLVRPMQVCSGIALAFVALITAMPTGAQTPSVRGANRDRDYYYPHSQDPYRSTRPVIRGEVEGSTIVRPVIIDSEIDHSTLVNPVIVSPGRHPGYDTDYDVEYDTRYRSRREYYIEYPSRPSYHSEPSTRSQTAGPRTVDAACMAFTEIRVACQ